MTAYFDDVRASHGHARMRRKSRMTTSVTESGAPRRERSAFNSERKGDDDERRRRTELGDRTAKPTNGEDVDDEARARSANTAKAN